jgi:uncharacterized repeat protein (TIGR03943 family)
VRRDTQSLLLVLLGGAVLRISADSTFLRYVRAWTRPYLLTAGAVLLLLGLLSLYRERAGGDPDRHGPPVGWLLLLPVFAIFLVAPPALGSYAAAGRGNEVAPPAGRGGTPPLPAGDPVTTTLTDFAVRAIWDGGRSLAGRRVRLVGFITPRPGGGFYLTRMVITCCAADARPLKVLISGGPAEQPAADSWLAV